MVWLDQIALALLGALAEVLVAESWQALRQQLAGDPAQRAVQGALLEAITRYAQENSTRPQLAKVLRQEDGPLNKPHVLRELGKVLPQAQDQPDYAMIGAEWQQAVDDPPQYVKFTREAQDLLAYFKSALRRTEPFRPLFDSRELETIAVHAPHMYDSLEAIEAGVRDLNDLLDSRFADMLTAYARSHDSIRLEIVDNSRLIHEKTQEFVGRQFVFDAINQFMATNPRGYFFVLGEPGIGKTALAAQLIKQNGYVHHFNRRSENSGTPRRFIKNVCSQLIVKYGLQRSDLPADAHQDATTLNACLQEASQTLPVGTKAVLVIDALDEAETPARGNPLLLPQSLPPNLYLVITMRPGTPEPFIEGGHRGALQILAKDRNNEGDIHTYLYKKAAQPGIQQYMRRQQLDEQRFVEELTQKSEGNFMYLHYILPEIERGAYQTLTFTNIPQGLRGYYDNHWQRMQNQENEAWFRYKLPVVVALAMAPLPLTIRQLAQDVGLISLEETITPLLSARVESVLREWRQFLDEEEVETQEGGQKGYRIYHQDFREYLFNRAEVGAIRLDIEERQLDNMFGAFLGNGS